LNGHSLRRRDLLLVSAGVTAASLARGAQQYSKAERGKLAMPGLYRGRVVAVNNPRSIISNQYQAAEVREMMRRGMKELTGADWTDAWRQFVEPGDVVGIKVNPVGQPHVISDATVLREIVDGLAAAGVRKRDIVVYDRYEAEFLKGGFDKWLPDGVRWMCATKAGPQRQQDIAGYDPDHYLDMALAPPGQDVSSDTARRSYAALYITKEVNKLINLGVLKDHQSAGVTVALKNLSHGLVNNVARSHSSGVLNACGAFIPAVVALPVIRNKAVLHICDGVKGVYHGGPFARPQFVWEHQTMYFATDPVALDRIGWEALDAQRKAAGKKPLLEDLPDPPFTNFARRQPEFVDICGAMGLGESNRSKIDLRRIQL
jgi:uncharacterized protein (DUF362 family)